MTKKFWTSLVLGLTLSSPALMVGCGEEAPKVDTPAATVVPAVVAPAVVAPADAKTPAPAPAPTKAP